jgi:PAS domain S-box-containing protein
MATVFAPQLDHMPDYSVFTLDCQGRVTSWNAGAERMKRYRAEEIVGEDFSRFYTLEDIQLGKPAEGLRNASKTGFFEEEGWRVRKDGSRFLAIAAIAAVYDKDGVLQGFVKVTRDITERKQAQGVLRLNEARLQALVQLNQMSGASVQRITDFALEAAVALTGSQIGYLAFVNEDETVLTMHSWSKTAMAQCAIQNKPIVYPVVTTGLWGEAVRQRKPVFTNDYQAPNPLKKGHPEGHVKVLRHMNAPIFDDDRIVIVAGVGNKEAPYDESDVRQLTLLMQGMWRLLQKKQADESLQRAHDELEQRVQERTAELAASNHDLEQFAYVASHDLQEPLRMVASYLQLLERRYQGKLDNDADDFIRFAVDGAKRMQQLINDLLTYSRIGSRGKPFVPVDWNAVFDEALKNLEKAVTEQGAEVTRDDLPTIPGDPTQAVQLLQNLLGNAVKFHGPEPPRVHVAAEPDGPAWKFSVRDNGIGIAPKYADRIFVIFQRLNSRVEYPGTGIGLAVCKRVVERHGGRIWFESRPKGGTTFYFTLLKGNRAL